MIFMTIYGGGMVQVCSRYGCKNHMIDLVKGLCINCANRNSCQFVKPEGGVWHCEEYR